MDGDARTPLGHNPIQIDANACVRCTLCDWVCPGDIIYKEEGDRETLPVVAYPDECWYCGHCESVCPTDAITIVFPDRMLHNDSDVISLLGVVDGADGAATPSSGDD